MALLGAAALAMWWDISTDKRAEFEAWHSHEHFPERLRLPGFLRGTRWQGADRLEASFVLYELAAYETLTSAAYRDRLNNPTPWSVAMMPHHRGMVRSQCRVLDSFGGGVGGWLLTVRLSPRHGQAETLCDQLRTTLSGCVGTAGITGCHLLRTETPPAAQTIEQKIRGSDAAADWIVLVQGYDGHGLDSVRDGPLAAMALGVDAVTGDRFRLAYVLTAGER